MTAPNLPAVRGTHVPARRTATVTVIDGTATITAKRRFVPGDISAVTLAFGLAVGAGMLLGLLLLTAITNLH